MKTYNLEFRDAMIGVVVGKALTGHDVFSFRVTDYTDGTSRVVIYFRKDMGTYRTDWRYCGNFTTLSHNTLPLIEATRSKKRIDASMAIELLRSIPI